MPSGVITIARVIDGHERVVLDEPSPFFRVEEPVCIFPIRGVPVVGTHHINVHSNSPYIQRLITGECGDDTTIRVIMDMTGGPVCAVVRESRLPDDFQWGDAIGAMLIEHIRKVWSRVTPGFWAVLKYEAHMDSEPGLYCEPVHHPAIKFDKSITWTIWT